MNNEFPIVFWLFVLLFIGGAGTCGALGCPHYNVWSAEMDGKATLARAEQDREIRVREARAQKEAEALLSEARVLKAKGEAEAEVERAKGAAEANRIIADGLGGPEGYLRYLYIETLKNSEGQIIYIPTEAGMPLVEAERSAQ